ncbi:MAG: hypothetical protein IJ093_04660 [Bacilli bacterium]|nr:hypothetical protein [Bacilli bacterium]
MKKHKILVVIGIVVAIIAVIVGLVGYFLVKDVKEEQVLRKEISSLNKLDITKDRYNTDIVTTGDYAVVESTIKDYLDDYATNLQGVLDILNDEKLSNVLSADNYKNDGPEFGQTKEYLENTKKDFNEKLTKLTNMTDKNTIIDAINLKNLIHIMLICIKS